MAFTALQRKAFQLLLIAWSLGCAMTSVLPSMATAQQDKCYPGLDCPEDLPKRGEDVNPPPPQPRQQPHPNDSTTGRSRPSKSYPTPPDNCDPCEGPGNIPLYGPPPPYSRPTPPILFCCTQLGKFGPKFDPNGPGASCYVPTPAGVAFGITCY